MFFFQKRLFIPVELHGFFDSKTIMGKIIHHVPGRSGKQDREIVFVKQRAVGIARNACAYFFRKRRIILFTGGIAHSGTHGIKPQYGQNHQADTALTCHGQSMFLLFLHKRHG